MLQISAQRLNDTLQTLGRIGETPEGMQRIAFSPADVEGRDYVMSLMCEAGLSVRVDAAGNVIARKEGSVDGLPAIGMGSHTDTVPKGGKYDGALGVLGAIECVQTLKDEGMTTRHPLEVLVYTNEEGTQFRRWLYGSRAMAGLMEDDDLTCVDELGVPIGDRLKDIGGDVSRISEAARSSEEFSAYLELHIEQGPVLHRTGIAIGDVTAITGRIGMNVSVRGFANHAGTTPMGHRRDALMAATHVIQSVNRIATDEEMCRVGTVGMVEVSPNAENVIPGRVDISVEFRDETTQRIRQAANRFREVCDALCQRWDVTIEIEEIGLASPAPMHDDIRAVIRDSARKLGLSLSSLPSGAGHDAQSMAEITKTGMIFVPSVDGVSHSPREYTSPEDCANGANVLLQTLLALDAELD